MGAKRDRRHKRRRRGALSDLRRRVEDLERQRQNDVQAVYDLQREIRDLRRRTEGPV